MVMAAPDTATAASKNTPALLLPRSLPPAPHTQVNASGSAFAAALESLPLDELELGSLRGVLVGAVADVDLAAQTGRLAANLASPRFSGLAGTSLSMNAR